MIKAMWQASPFGAFIVISSVLLIFTLIGAGTLISVLENWPAGDPLNPTKINACIGIGL